MTTTLPAYLEAARARVDRALDRVLPSAPACPPVIAEAMRYSVFAGGKRLRPILTLAAADAVGLSATDEDNDLALPAACAIELIHTYSLIHDDLPAMDNDTLRRGRPTLHVVYGDGIAVLAGDGLHAEAFRLLAREPATEDPEIMRRKLRVTQTIGDAASAMGMVGGQAIDLQATGGGSRGHVRSDAPAQADVATLEHMHACKTGALIRAASVAGAIMAGGSDDEVTRIDRYAAMLGLAFQIVDDILDVEGSAATLGKTTGKDAAEQKPTYVALFGLERSRQMANECAERARRELAAANLTSGWLAPIVDWVIGRKN